MPDNTKKPLTCNNASVTLAQTGEAEVDATARRLIKRREEIRREISRLAREVNAIEIALKSAGIKPDIAGSVDLREMDYVRKQPFVGATLPDACKIILQDYNGRWLSKSQIEYLIEQGGYKFAAKNSKNSVNVSLQRLALEGSIIAERSRGSRGNKYKWPTREQGNQGETK